MFMQSCRAVGSRAKEASGALWQWWFEERTSQLKSRMVGNSEWQALEKPDTVAVLANKYQEASAAGLLYTTNGQ